MSPLFCPLFLVTALLEVDVPDKDHKVDVPVVFVVFLPDPPNARLVRAKACVFIAISI